MIKMLLVEDDDFLGFIIKDGMELIGEYDVKWCTDPISGLEAFDTFQPDVVVSDIEMPGMSGLEMVKKIREKDSFVPVILETGVASSKVIMEAYGIGIDNYIKKPFLPAELDAYIKSLLRRMGSAPRPATEAKPEEPKPDDNELIIGQLKFNSQTQTLITPTKRIELSMMESVLLALLVRKKGLVCSKDEIAEAVWGGAKYMNTQSLDVFIYSLRKYMAEDESVKLKTIRGVGYVLEVLN